MTESRAMPAKLAASILSADFSRLAEEVKLVEPYSDALHIDAMDGQFVPTIGIGPQVVASLRQVTNLFFHCHLMLKDPERQFEEFAKAGANLITPHLEAVDDPAAAIDALDALGVKAGLAINPETPAEALFEHLDRLADVIVMTVNPGWAGQPFLPEGLPKVAALRAEIDRRGLTCDIEVDGGINEETGRRCIEAGATIIAAASSIFKAPDPVESVRRLAAVAHGDQT
jgi:ribulose-phosphate 3-epimerase